MTTRPTDLDRLISVYATAADALRAVRDLDTPARARVNGNENGRTAAKIRARLTVNAKTRKATVHKDSAWTAARRKAHGARMRAMWANKKGGN